MNMPREKDLVRSVGQRAAHAKRDIRCAVIDAQLRTNARFDAWERERAQRAGGKK